MAAGVAEAAGPGWVIKKETWTEADENAFSSFVTAIGDTGCTKVDQCMKSKGNPYRNSDSSSIYWSADCGKFPYLLRAYFAWKNGLPFQYSNQLRPSDPDDPNSGNLRTTLEGNVIVGRRDVVQPRPGSPINGVRFLMGMIEDVYSATFRYSSHLDPARGGHGDMYHVAIDRKNIRPGTVMYDAAGHVALIYKVSQTGVVTLLDAHPQNWVTRVPYDTSMTRSRPGMGAGFKNWRPLRLVGARRQPSGELVGGKIEALPNSASPGFSMEQFYGTETNPQQNWRQAKFVHKGANLQFHSFVRSRLAVGDLKYHPIQEMKDSLGSLCDAIKDRVLSVQEAITKSIHRKDHPARLPDNIYGTSGEWEDFSTPSRDARLKTSMKDIRDHVQKMVDLHKSGSKQVVYTGANLGADLRQAYIDANKACSFDYVKSDGSKQRLHLDDVIKRAFTMSFDPYHCIEMRWGATGQELASCDENTQDKRNWYQAEQRLRNQIERTYDVKMGFSLSDLMAKAKGSGVDAPPDVDLRGYLKGL